MAAVSSDQRRSLHVLAYMLFRMGQESRAEKMYRGILALSPEGRPDRHALTALAAIALEKGEGEKALEYIRTAMEGVPLSSRHASLFLMKAQALWLEGRRAEAEAARDEFLFLREKSGEHGA